MGNWLKAAQLRAQDGIFSAADMAATLHEAEVLKDGVISYGEARDLNKIIKFDAADFGTAKMTTAASYAANNLLGLARNLQGHTSREIFGLSQEVGDKLEAQQITTGLQLMTAASTPQDRAKLAADSKISEMELTNFAERADLARVVGIGPKYAAVLDMIDINNVQSLGKQRADSLRTKIQTFLATDTGKEVTSRTPSLATIDKWIANAKMMPSVLRYAGDSGAGFSLAAYEALSETQRGRLILGGNVDLGEGSVYRAGDLKREIPLAKPAAVKTAIDEIINGTKNPGWDDFEYSELAGIERVKLGDKTVGFRLRFDVSVDGGYGYEGFYTEGDDDWEWSEEPPPGYGYEGADVPGFGGEYSGWVRVAVDVSGKILDWDGDEYAYYP